MSSEDGFSWVTPVSAGRALVGRPDHCRKARQFRLRHLWAKAVDTQGRAGPEVCVRASNENFGRRLIDGCSRARTTADFRDNKGREWISSYPKNSACSRTTCAGSWTASSFRLSARWSTMSRRRRRCRAAARQGRGPWIVAVRRAGKARRTQARHDGEGHRLERGVAHHGAAGRYLTIFGPPVSPILTRSKARRAKSI